jgi:hypothetical protein
MQTWIRSLQAFLIACVATIPVGAAPATTATTETVDAHIG